MEKNFPEKAQTKGGKNEEKTTFLRNASTLFLVQIKHFTEGFERFEGLKNAEFAIPHFFAYYIGFFPRNKNFLNLQILNFQKKPNQLLGKHFRRLA